LNIYELSITHTLNYKDSNPQPSTLCTGIPKHLGNNNIPYVTLKDSKVFIPVTHNWIYFIITPREISNLCC